MTVKTWPVEVFSLGCGYIRGSEFSVQGLGFRVKGLGLRVEGSMKVLEGFDKGRV